MLDFLRDKTSDRKLRLFACVFGRAVRESQNLLGRSAVAAAERYADGLVNDEDLAFERRKWACSPEETGPVAPSAYDGAWEAVDWLTSASECMKMDPDALPHFPVPADAVLKRSIVLLRDIFGNPFRPSPPLPCAVLTWTDGTVRRIAEVLYEERAFDRLATLADPLLDAGCDDEALIAHCRSEWPHVRGCWAVDLTLGKA
jgi:hypothetical protein